MIIDLVGEAENFSRIENIFRSEGAFDFPHHIEERIAKLLAHVLGARDADSVLGGERSFELPDEGGSLIGYQPELSQIVRTMEIENGPDMEQTARGMSVVARFQSEGFHDRLQPADVIGQLRRTNRCVFNERDRFRWTDAAGQK